METQTETQIAAEYPEQSEPNKAQNLGRPFRDVPHYCLVGARFVNMQRTSPLMGRPYIVKSYFPGNPDRVCRRYENQEHTETVLASFCAFDRQLVQTPDFSGDYERQPESELLGEAV